MTVSPKIIFAAFCVGILLLLLITKFTYRSQVPEPTGPPTPAKSQSLYETKENSGGNVTVIVTPKNLTKSQPPVFEVDYETHSVNLDFDDTQIAKLADNTGTDYRKPEWEGPPPGGHHRKGTLTFPNTLNVKATSVTLTLTGIAGVPTRDFTWEVKSR